MSQGDNMKKPILQGHIFNRENLLRIKKLNEIQNPSWAYVVGV